MMSSRTLKFRAWDKKRQRWVREYDEHLEDADDAVYEKEYSEDAYWLDGDVATDLELVNTRLRSDKYIWEQYTEQEDIKGKEIYEGDILKTPVGICKCVWDTGGGGWAYQFKTHVTDFMDIVSDWHKRAEVIGNIHETPELYEDQDGRN